MGNVDLKSCHVCGKKDRLCIGRSLFSFWGKYAVCCDRCSYFGPSAFCKLFALLRWNWANRRVTNENA